MVVSLLGSCCGSLLSFAVCFVYPAKLTSQLLFGCGCGGKASSGEGESTVGVVNEYIHWTTFWIIFIVWQFCEQSLIPPFVISFIPFFYELKSFLFFWLCSDRFRGAGWLWLEVVEPVYRPISMKLAQAFNEQCPASVKTYLGCPPPMAPSGGAGDAAAAPSSKKGRGGSADAAANVFEDSRAVASAVGKESLGGQ